MRRFPGVDHAAAIGAFGKPIVIANGERDIPIRSSEARFLDLHPNAKVMMIPDAGYACAIQRPGVFAETVKTLMSEVSVA